MKKKNTNEATLRVLDCEFTNLKATSNAADAGEHCCMMMDTFSNDPRVGI